MCNIVFIKKLQHHLEYIYFFHDNFKTFSFFLLEIANFLFPLRFYNNFRIFDYDSKRNTIWFQKIGRRFVENNCTEWIFKYPASNYLFGVNNINTRKRCEICSKLKEKDSWTTLSGFSNYLITYHSKIF